MAQQVFYVDLSLNPEVDSTGDISTEINIDAIKQSLRMMLDTTRGSRIFTPEYGARIKGFLFEPFDTSVAERIGLEIKETISNFEPRVSLINVNVEMDFNKTSYDIQVVYRINNTEVIDVFKVTLEKL